MVFNLHSPPCDFRAAVVELHKAIAQLLFVHHKNRSHVVL